MKRLNLPKGLSVFGGPRRSGKTNFLLQWANYLAESQKVLFLNWGNYEGRLNAILKEMKMEKSDNLIIDAHYPFFDISAFIDIYNRVEHDKIEIIFFDDIHLSQYNRLSSTYNADEAAISGSLLFLVDKLGVKTVISTDVETNFRMEPPKIVPKFRSFVFSRDLVNRAQQVYYLHNSSTDENIKETSKNKVEIFSLKNKDNKEFVVSFDQLNLQIIPEFINEQEALIPEDFAPQLEIKPEEISEFTLSYEGALMWLHYKPYLNPFIININPSEVFKLMKKEGYAPDEFVQDKELKFTKCTLINTHSDEPKYGVKILDIDDDEVLPPLCYMKPE